MQKVKVINAGVAQLAERLICNEDVVGSTPITSFKGAIAEAV